MKFFCSIVLFVLFLSYGVQAQSRLDLRITPVKDEFLAMILNLSEMKELKPKRPVDGNFFYVFIPLMPFQTLLTLMKTKTIL